jgi:hypothetical protein
MFANRSSGFQIDFALRGMAIKSGALIQMAVLKDQSLRVGSWIVGVPMEDAKTSVGPHNNGQNQQ